MKNIDSRPAGKLSTVPAAETMRRIYSLPIAEITEILVRMILLRNLSMEFKLCQSCFLNLSTILANKLRKMAKDAEFEKEFKKLSIEATLQLRKGESVFGKGGALQPLFERILNAALEGEMDAHLTEESRENGNRRNGKMSKQVQTPYGKVTVQTT